MVMWAIKKYLLLEMTSHESCNLALSVVVKYIGFFRYLLKLFANFYCKLMKTLGLVTCRMYAQWWSS